MEASDNKNKLVGTIYGFVSFPYQAPRLCAQF